MMSKKPGVIRRFFSGLWRFLTLLRIIIVNGVFLLVLLLFIGALLDSPITEVPEGGALVLQPSGNIVEENGYVDPFSSLFGNGRPAETVLHNVLDAIETAREDNDVSSLVLHLDRFQGAGFPQLQAIASAITRFKAGGKPVYAVADSYNQSQYYLAAHADEIMVNPMGGVDLQGFGSYQIYFKSALDALEVNMHIFRVGEYKSAVEPFLRDDMSAEAREANSAWLQDLWQAYVADVSEQRAVPANTIDDYINNLDRRLARVEGDSAQLALESGLVDRIADRNTVREYLGGEIAAAPGEDDFRQIGFRDYLRARRDRLSPPGESVGRVGVIVAQGTILDGEQPPGSIGGDSLATLIRRARESDAVKAVVLRIDSGGGSAFASEVIRRELLQLRQAGKPLVVSMGSVAASGGYWIASPADEIWASPATITGSIGIFALYPTFRDTLDSIGIHTDGVGTTELAGAFVPGQELPEVAREAMQQTLENGYSRFLDVVASGRDMSREEVDEVGRGRVWSGRQALERGLVDRLGHQSDAVAAAARLAGLDDYSTIYIEHRLSPAQRLLQQLSESFSAFGLDLREQPAPAGPVLSMVRELDDAARSLLEYNDPRGLYLRCLVCDIR